MHNGVVPYLRDEYNIEFTDAVNREIIDRLSGANKRKRPGIRGKGNLHS